LIFFVPAAIAMSSSRERSDKVSSGRGKAADNSGRASLASFPTRRQHGDAVAVFFAQDHG